MRRLSSLLLLPILIGPILMSQALAEDVPKTAANHTRQTWEQHFVQANIAHDGHLTREEAKSGFASIGKHFDDIDIDHKGYVTQNDVRAWRVMRKAAHRLTKPPADKLKPQHAFQIRSPNQPALPTTRTVALLNDRPVSAGAVPGNR